MSLSVRALSQSGDMTFGQGSANYLTDSPAAVSQILGTQMKLWQTEWFLNLSAGIPYISKIAGYGNLTMGALILKTAALAAPGVININDWSVAFDPQTRQYSVTGSSINTTFGTTSFPMSITIAPSNT